MQQSKGKVLIQANAGRLERTWMTVITAAILGLTGTALSQVSGNISPATITIDGNLFGDGGTDWVVDSVTNVDPAQLIDGTIAVGIDTDGSITGLITGAAKQGHWRGVRIADGIAGGEQNIFLTGGKENDTTTWNVGAGSVGSAKYDATQAYLANNQTFLYFGMERRGNNGTTAFDFEFNQNAPANLSGFIPTRTVGDVLFTFEMSGSGNSGSATPHYFTWNGTAYIEGSIPGVQTAINNAPTQAAPWGYVNSKGNWVLGFLDNFEFAEASVTLTQAFPNFNVCGQVAYVQVRTRSSATATSDLKDTTHIFPFIFGGPSAEATYTNDCFGDFGFDATGSKDASGGTSLTYAWTFSPPAGVVLSGCSGSGTTITGPDASGNYHATGLVGCVHTTATSKTDINATLVVTQTGTSCSATNGPTVVTVVPQLQPTATKKSANGVTLSVTVTGSSAGADYTVWEKSVDGGATFAPVIGSQVNGSGPNDLSYSGFDNDVSGDVIVFTLNGDSYRGILRQVQFRLHAYVSLGTLQCDNVSTTVTVKKVVAVDP